MLQPPKLDFVQLGGGFREEKRETGLEPPAACLEGILLYAVWQPERPGERKPSSYLLVKCPELSYSTY